MNTKLQIAGTHCSACKMLIESVCLDTPGITAAHVDYKTGLAEIEHDASLDWEALKKEIEGLGDYKISILN